MAIEKNFIRSASIRKHWLGDKIMPKPNYISANTPRLGANASDTKWIPLKLKEVQTDFRTMKNDRNFGYQSKFGLRLLSLMGAHFLCLQRILLSLIHSAHSRLYDANGTKQFNLIHQANELFTGVCNGTCSLDAIHCAAANFTPFSRKGSVAIVRHSRSQDTATSVTENTKAKRCGIHSCIYSHE